MERIHRSQMTEDEIDFAEYLCYALRGWEIESGLIHAEKRGRKFTREEVLHAIQTGKVIELNSNARLLIRSAKGICVVVSPQSRTVITVWYNAPSDNHITLKRGEYTWKVNVIEYLKSLRSTR